jgi:hypothetical protein
MKYTFRVGSNVNVPDRFSLYTPQDGKTGVDTRPIFRWSQAYNATSYTLIVAENPNFTNPVINQQNIGTPGTSFEPNFGL